MKNDQEVLVLISFDDVLYCCHYPEQKACILHLSSTLTNSLYINVDMKFKQSRMMKRGDLRKENINIEVSMIKWKLERFNSELKQAIEVYSEWQNRNYVELQLQWQNRNFADFVQQAILENPQPILEYSAAILEN